LRGVVVVHRHESEARQHQVFGCEAAVAQHAASCSCVSPTHLLPRRRHPCRPPTRRHWTAGSRRRGPRRKSDARTSPRRPATECGQERRVR
jgi:hypothetical protein